MKSRPAEKVVDIRNVSHFLCTRGDLWCPGYPGGQCPGPPHLRQSRSISMPEFHSDSPVQSSNLQKLGGQTDFRFSKSGFLDEESSAADFCAVLSSSTLEDARIAIQAYSEKHGKTLPSLNIIETGKDSVSVAAYRLGEGKLMLKGLEPGSMEFAISLAHEVKHSEQDLLMLWHLADKHGIGQTLSPEKRRSIQEEYQVGVGSTVKDEILDSMIKLRDGKILDPESGIRAEKLMAAIREDKENPNSLAVLQGYQQFLGELYEFQQGHGGREAINKILALANLDDEARKFYGESLFGQGALSRESIINQFGDPAKKDFNELKAAESLFKQMKKRDTELLKEMQEEFKKYAGRYHEAEAFAVESKIQKLCSK